METEHFGRWKKTAIEAIHEYASMSLSALSSFDSSLSDEISSDVDAEHLPGSIMTLTTKDKPVVIGMSADNMVLTALAKAITQSAEQAELNRAEVQDAMNEMLNVVCGGVKRRLNDTIPGGITLGIPEFYQQLPDLMSVPVQTRVFIDQLPIYLWVIE